MFPLKSVVETLRTLPPPDLEREYGLSPSDLTLFPDKLGKELCLVNVDTRPWKPSEDLTKETDVGWGRLNQFLYGKHSFEN